MARSSQCVPCTKNGDVTCHLLEHREAINKVLLGAGLELCEDTRQAGGARLALVQVSACNYQHCAQPDDPVKSAAFKLTTDLLTCHHCFTSLEIYSAAFCTRHVREALSNCPDLKSLTIYFLNHTSRQDNNHADIGRLINSLTSLEELVFKTESGPPYPAVELVDCWFLARTLRNLTTLDVRNLKLNPQYVQQFVWALTANRTIANLAVGGCVYSADLHGLHGQLFAYYLMKRAATLKKLTLSDHYVCHNQVLWKRLISAFCQMTALEELTLDVCIGFNIFTEVTALFAEVVLRCPTLRQLLLPWPAQPYRSQFLNGFQVPGYNVAQWLEPWITVLRTTSTLHGLGIYLPGMEEPQCRTLLQAVAKNETLKQLALQEVPLIVNSRGSTDLMALSQIIQELKLGDRVCFANLFVTFENAPKILASAGLSTLNFKNLRFELSAQRDPDLLNACCAALSRRGTFTSIEVSCKLIYQPAFDILLNWIAKESTLTHVEVVACDDAGTASYCGECVRMYDWVVWALSCNANIARVSLAGIKVNSKHLYMLVDCACTHRNLVGISLAPTCRGIDPGSSTSDVESYVVAMRELQEIMRKNAARISVAARFVLGDDIRKGARLIERLHEHPRLLELVRQGASVTDAQAKAMAHEAMERVRYCSFRDYLRLTGVVKQKVQRLDPDSNRVHLSDLPAECWLHVRQYLKITHVVIPCGVEDWEWPTGPVPP
ncbi:uncharacterized protein [Dermacentor andersoni]|uniref:uncharacterized protein n=1 Tax=Dermacentor andersoni TaxID=34620 RepID=UPI002417E87E|nr:uncharacterized protein LOC126525679 [Dermacentor andersoni]